jgi:hypothetical protein
MMKKIILSVLLFSVCFVYGQNRMAKEVHELQQEQSFEMFQVFKQDKIALSQSTTALVPDATALKLNSIDLSMIVNNRPNLIQLQIPYNGQTLKVDLFKKTIFSSDFRARTAAGESIDYSPGAYYRGIAHGENQSVAAYSFFKGSAFGLVSIPGQGNIVVSQMKGSKQYVVYSDKNIKAQNPFECEVKQIDGNTLGENPYTNQETSREFTTNCVRIYYEIAYQPYLTNGSDVTQTMDWMTAVHNNISTLYSNDSITLALSDMMVWTTDDPYNGGPGENLSDFRENRSAFSGDLGHLVNYPATTSVAYVNSLCGGYRYAYSGVEQFYDAVPTYSWTINAMTHEMGHSLGSPHTHACFWNGNDTAIDGCGPASGNGEGCDASIPTNGGTIMSYCHLVSTGINLSKGFGPQVSSYLRSNIDTKQCLGTDCINSCVGTLAGMDIQNVGQTTADVSLNDTVSNYWNYYIYNQETSNYVNSDFVEQTDFTVSNLDPNTYYELVANNNCSQNQSFNQYVRKSFITDGDYCNGDKFYDIGGESAGYNDNQYFTKTFYPPNDQTAFTISFDEFDLEQGYDFMNIYDGESTDASVFVNGEDLTGPSNPGSFAATSESGAITIEFVSDANITAAGWSINFECTNLSVNNQVLSNIRVYPNPMQNTLNIDSKIAIKSVQIFDLQGRKVIEKSDVTVESVEVNSLSTGIYFAKLKTDQGHFKMMKLIKE